MKDNKIPLKKSNKDSGPVDYKNNDPKEPTGSKEDISTPKKNSGYDEKQPGSK